MIELNGDNLRRRAEAGETLGAHEALYERLYWALEYWGSDGQEADDAARSMIRAFVEELQAPVVQALRDIDRGQKRAEAFNGAEVAWYYGRDDVEDALGLQRGALDHGEYTEQDMEEDGL